VNRALEETDLPDAQFVILNHLASLPAGGWTITELASTLEIGQPGASEILRRLALKDHVQVDTDPGDARLRRHRLTRAGAVAHKEAFRRITPQADDIFAGWQDDDIDTLHGLLFKLKSSLRD